jgi:nicotinamide mononucleotide adenylyltransferase
MDCTGFSAAQQQALLDLLILAMYADGHLTNVEDAQLQELLQAMGFAEPSDREREFDAAVTRVRPFAQSILKAKDHAIRLAATFTTREQQKQVYAAVQKIMLADNNVSTWENTLLTELDSKFRM